MYVSTEFFFAYFAVTGAPEDTEGDYSLNQIRVVSW